MRRLTPRASNYLKSLQRDTDAVTNKEELKRFFNSQNVPIFEPVIDFGVSYSGLTLRTKTKKSDAFTASLVSSQDIRTNRQYDYEKEGENFLFYCGDHETAQFYFYINQMGQFCSGGYKGSNVLSSSFEIEVEQYAYRNEVFDWIESPYYELEKTAELESKLISDFDIIPECSDDFNGWFLGDNIIAQKGVWLHEPRFYLHFFGKTQKELDKVINHFKDAEMIKATS